MIYDFKCSSCDKIHPFAFAAVDYDKKVRQDGKLKRYKCPDCKSTTLYRYMEPGEMPGVLGGTRNYVSMERYWAQNKEEARRKEEELSKTIAERHAKRVTSNVDKQQTRQGRDKRHKGYGKGHGEQKLNSGF